MTDSLEHLENCPTCGVSIDTSAFEPLSRVSCPECGGPMIVGQFIAHYELIEPVGRGGMGVVYKARDTSLNRFVALKVLRKDHSQHAEFIAQLETEAAITASINHPHVVRVFTTGTDAGRFYIAMELVDKGTLDDLIGLQGQVAEAQVLEIAIQIAQGLRAAYQHGLIHRDVKPGNILFADAHTAKIVDFGLAMLEAAAQGGGEVWGTPYYVAPEKLDRKPEDFRSDMYSLGATLFHALAGRPPYEAEDASMVALKHLKSQAVSLQAFAPHVSSSTAYVINRTLLKDPDKRYQSYDEFIEHLEYAKSELEHGGAGSRSKKRVVLETEADQKMMSYVTFGMLTLIVVLGAAAWWYFASKEPAKKPDGPIVKTTPAAAPTPTVNIGKAEARLTAEFMGARRLLLDGKFAEASTVFQRLATENKNVSPLAEWSIVHWGLSELLAGKDVESRTAFAKMMERRTSQIPELRIDNLGAFFRQLSDLARKDAPAPAGALETFNDSPAAAMAYLVLGLKNWNAGDYDTGGGFLRGFDRANSDTPYGWIKEYTKLVENQLADFNEYRTSVEMAKMATTKELEDQALTEIAKSREKLHTKGKLEEKFDQLTTELKTRSTARAKEHAKTRESDKQAMASALEEVVAAAKTWNFTQALEIAKKAKLATDDMRRERASMVQQLELLQRWKSATLAELNANRPRVVLKKRDGSEIKNVSKISEAGVESAGAPPTSWSDVSPDSVVAAAASLLKPDLAPEILAERRWMVGAFGSMTGSKWAEQLLLEATKVNPEFATDLPLVAPPLRSTGENLAKGKTATASGFVKTEQYDESPGKALDNDPNTKWCAKDGGPKWLAVDLGAPAEITRWIVHHATAGGELPDMNTVDFELQSSDDGTNWKTVDKVADNKADVTARSVPVFSARHLRLWITKQNGRKNDPTARIVDFSVQAPVKASGNADPVKNFFDSNGWMPAPTLTSVNIGKVDQRGSTHLSDRNGEYGIRVSGEDIWKAADSFRFTHQKLKGDGEIVARVSSIENIHEWSKAGVMFRESLAPESPNVLFALSPFPRLTMQTRPTSGVETLSQSGEAPRAAPLWIKLVREGSKFTGYTSDNGFDWKEARSTTAQMPAEIYVGLAFTSHINSRVGLAKFDFVRILPKVAGQPGPIPKS